MTQNNAAAERSAHAPAADVTEGVWPVVEVAKGQWRLKVLVETEARHDARVSELLEANNREVERRRKAEAENVMLRAALGILALPRPVPR